MSKISANTLFHFTNSADNIIQIIKAGFKPRFCLENFGAEFLLTRNVKVETAIPMVCFCDLPLSNIAEHLAFYGHYGIGLSKAWGEQNGLAPLTYVHDKSAQLKHLSFVGYILWQFCNHFKLDDKIPLHQNPKVMLMELANFYKPYKGKMWKNSKYRQKCFYDEKEWRYVPFNTKPKSHSRLSKKEYLDDIVRAAANDDIGNRFPLKFKSTDIKYLIVKKENEKISLCDAISKMTRSYKSNEIKILQTKIISAEQIEEDF